MSLGVDYDTVEKGQIPKKSIQQSTQNWPKVDQLLGWVVEEYT